MTVETQHLKQWQSRLMAMGKIWFVVAAIGQLAFIAFIIAYYGTRTMGGDYASWNDKELITGHVPGDDAGNTMFAAHVLLAAIMTLSGLVQLIPMIRRRYPTLHRWSGRVFLFLASFLAIGGLWLTWVRGSHLSDISGLSVSLNAVLILICAFYTVRFAMARRIVDHQRWAMRLFMVANGVWFFRVGLMAWILINQSPRWMNATLSGPADIGLSLGSYLIPLLGLEIYMRAKVSKSPHVKRGATIVVALLTVIMAIGILGSILFMWT